MILSPEKNNPSIVAIPYLEPDLDWELVFFLLRSLRALGAVIPGMRPPR